MMFFLLDVILEEPAQVPGMEGYPWHGYLNTGLPPGKTGITGTRDILRQGHLCVGRMVKTWSLVGYGQGKGLRLPPSCGADVALGQISISCCGRLQCPSTATVGGWSWEQHGTQGKYCRRASKAGKGIKRGEKPPSAKETQTLVSAGISPPQGCCYYLIQI